MIKHKLEFDQKVIQAFKDKPKKMRAGALRGLKKGMLVVEARAKQKTSGQVLRVRTGHLRRSIQSSAREGHRSFIGLVGTHVSYGKIHELGYKGPMQVKAHSRRTRSGTVASVRAHQRMVNMPKRPFLVPSIKERMSRIGYFVLKHIQEALKR